MQSIFLVLTGMAFGSTVLVVAKLLMQYRDVLVARVLILLLLSAGAYMIQPFLEAWPNTLFVLGLAGMATPAFFWMFTSTLFRMENAAQKLHLGHYISLILCVALGLVKCVVEITDTSPIHTISLITMSGLALLGMFDIIKNWQSDLVECRRLLRSSLAISSGTFMLFIVVSEFIYGHGELPLVLNYTNIVIISFLALSFGYIVLVSDSNMLVESIDELLPESLIEEAPEVSVADKKWLEQLTHAMEIELCYRKVDLTIRSLSEHLVIPEHQLRRLINRHMGYRNFNDYLNRYRVKDAAEQLQNPELVRTPILTIAIESGYASLTTFNKAFKSLKDMTPSEFRRTNGLTGS